MTLYNLSILIFVPQNGFLAAFKRLDGTMDCCSNNSLTDLCFSYVKRHTSEREVSRTLTPPSFTSFEFSVMSGFSTPFPSAVRLHAGAQNGDGHAGVPQRPRLRRRRRPRRLRDSLPAEPDPLHPGGTPTRGPHAVRGLPAASPACRYEISVCYFSF